MMEMWGHIADTQRTSLPRPTMTAAHRTAPLTDFDSIKPIISELRIFGGVTEPNGATESSQSVLKF